jgi:hypothetical protein
VIPWEIIGEDAKARADRLAKLQQEARDAQEAVEAAQAGLERAKRDDLDAAAQARRKRVAGVEAKEPKATEPAARARLERAAREAAAARAAALGEAAEFAVHVSENREAIVGRSEAAEAEIEGSINRALDELEEALQGRERVRLVRSWANAPVDGATIKSLGMRTAPCAAEIEAIRQTLEGQEVRDRRREHDANHKAWAELVARAHRGVEPESPVGTYDAAVEAEIARLQREGEPVPRPTAARWVKKLGVPGGLPYDGRHVVDQERVHR